LPRAGYPVYRQPQDPLLVPLFTLIREGKLAQNWPLEQDELLERLQKSCDMQQISPITTRCSSVKSAAWRRIVQRGKKGQRKQKFALFSERGCRWQNSGRPFGTLLLAASWIEDQLAKMKVKRSKRCLKSICCRGAVRSSAKSKRTPHHSGERWLR
jgi:hypothetical protein